MARPRTDPFDRMMERVEKGDGCWLWPGYCNRDGYGVIKEVGQRYFVHRLSYERHHGVKLDEDVIVRHKCDVPNCIRPDHLETGTHLDNVADRVARGRSAVGERNGRYIDGRHCKPPDGISGPP